MKKSYFFPIVLIIVGCLLLLNQFDLLIITRPYLIITGFSIIGLVFVRKSFETEFQKGLLGGSFFLLSGIVLFLVDLGYIPAYDNVIFPILLMILGLSNLLYFLFTRKSYTNVTFGLIFLASGLPFLVYHYGSITFWEISDAFSTYWPILLITAGFGFLIDGILKKAK